MHLHRRHAGVAATALLAASFALSPIAAAPHAAAASPTPTVVAKNPAPGVVTATPTPATPTVTPLPTPTLAVNPATSVRGGQVTLTGKGFDASERVDVTIDGVTAPITTTTATTTGAFTATATIPYAAATGARTLTATGQTSHRSATAHLTLNAVAATLVANPSTTTRGGTTTLSGTDWAPSEAITVTLSGVTTPITVVHATAQGAFPSTTVTIPYAATDGAHTLTATGGTSGRKATTNLTLSAVTATFSVTPAATNRGGLITLAGGNFAPGEAVTVTVSGVITPLATITATAQGTLSATGVSIPYSVPVGAHTLTATGAVSKRTASAGITVVALAPSIALSPAAASPGQTITVSGKGFGRQEQVTLSLNGAALVTSPSAITTTDGAFSATFAVPNGVLNGQNTVSAVGNESRVTAVATLTGQLQTSPRFYFAGGLNTTAAHSTVQVLNTNDAPASLSLDFYYGNGASYARTATVAAHARASLPVSGFGLPAGTFGLALKADRQVSAQLTIERNGQDGDSLLGNTGLGTRWYLAEGYTGLTFHETVSVLNPDPTVAAHVQMQLLPFGGRQGKTVTITVAPHSNSVTDINALLPGQSLSIIATSDRPVVVERTLTFSNAGYGLTTRAGTNTAATSWIFAEGTTVNRFQTFLTILNPNATATRVTASFFSRGGASLGSDTIVVQGHSRANIKLNDLLSASGVASVVTGDQPIVVERPEYFGSPNAPFIAGSDVFGRNGAGVRWSFPAGDTQGRSEFLLIFNPSATSVPIDVTLYGDNGQTATKRIIVAPTVRYNVDLSRLFPGFAPQHGAVLQSANKVGFVAEQTVFAPNHSTLRSTQGLAQ